MAEYKSVTPSTPTSDLIGEILISARHAESDSGGGWIVVKYLDYEIVLYKNIGFHEVSHSIEDRETWESQIEAGYWKFANVDSVREPFLSEEFTEQRLKPLLGIDGVGESTLDSLIENGYISIQSILNSSDDELIEVNHLGQTSIDRIRREFSNYEERIVSRIE